MKSGVRKPTLDELALINQSFAKRELKEDEIYVFDVNAADNRTVTAYFSRLGKDMIEAFQKNVQARHADPKSFSVGYLFGHRDDMIPSGTLFKAELRSEPVSDGRGEETIHFRPTVFMLKNLNVGGINTDDYVKAYEAGHTDAVSVGFIGSSFICDICNNDIRNFFKCEHIPGRVYNIAPDGDPPVMQQCTYTVHQGWFRDRNLLELSAVYAAALAGAQIDGGGMQMSTKDLANQGRGYFAVDKDGEAKPTGKVLSSRNIKDFQKDDVLRFNHSGDGVIELIGRVEKEKEGDGKMAKTIEELQAEITTLQNESKELQDKLSALVDKHAKLDEEHTRVVKVLALSETDKVASSEKLDLATKEVEKLKAEKAGLQATIDEFVNALKKEAEEWDVRLNGTTHNAELFKKEMDALSIAELKLKIETLQKQVKEKFPNGRQSSSGGEAGASGTGGKVVASERPVHDRPELYKIR